MSKVIVSRSHLEFGLGILLNRITLSSFDHRSFERYMLFRCISRTSVDIVALEFNCLAHHSVRRMLTSQLTER